MSGHWIGVASAEHVRRGIAGGFMQVGHGKAAPLRRIARGDGVAYYAPSETLGGKVPLQAFVGIGVVGEGEPYTHDMGGGFVPWRRNVIWADADPAPIRPLLDVLDFTAGNPRWGYPFRTGLFSISGRDFEVIAEAMQARWPTECRIAANA